MDRLETGAWLDWWANSSTCLGRIGVQVTITAGSANWQAVASIEPALENDDREGFEFLCDLDPMFTLRFADGSHVDVIVSPAEAGNLCLREAVDDDVERPLDVRVPLT